MKILIFFVIYMIFFENRVLAQSPYYTCKNVTENCYYLNELLAPCFYKIDFGKEIYIGTAGGIDSFPFPDCMCSQDFYNNLISCGISCNFPVDNPLKFESDCRIGKHPITIDEESVPKTPVNPNTSTPSNTPVKNSNNVQSSSNNSSSSIVGKVAGSIVPVVAILGAVIIAIVIYRNKQKKKHPPPPPTSQPFNDPNLHYTSPPPPPPTSQPFNDPNIYPYTSPPPPPPPTAYPVYNHY